MTGQRAGCALSNIRGSSHGNNEYPFNVDEYGISLLPLTAMGLTHKARTERVSSGIQELDQMMSGKGFYRAAAYW